MAFFTRAQWAARPPRSRSPLRTSNGVYIHHTTGATLGREDCAAWVRSIQAFHINSKDWADIGYSFLVCKHGDIFEGRGWGIVGAHTSGFNSVAHGFAFLGDGSADLPPRVLPTFAWLLQEHTKRYGPGYVKGHRDVASTACPGNKLYAAIPLMKEVSMANETISDFVDVLFDGETGGVWALKRDGGVYAYAGAPFLGAYPQISDEGKTAVRLFPFRGGYAFLTNSMDLYHFPR